jgi:hypothetical protein
MASRGHGDKLSRKQEAALVALLSEPTVRKAAAVVGVNEKTLREWMQDPGFAAAWRKARRKAFEAAIGRLQKLAERAAVTLGKNLKAAKEADQIRAAALILKLALEGVKVEDLALQVEQLRAEMEAMQSHGDGGTGPAGGQAAGGCPPAEGGVGDGPDHPPAG